LHQCHRGIHHHCTNKAKKSTEITCSAYVHIISIIYFLCIVGVWGKGVLNRKCSARGPRKLSEAVTDWGWRSRQNAGWWRLLSPSHAGWLAAGWLCGWPSGCWLVGCWLAAWRLAGWLACANAEGRSTMKLQFHCFLATRNCSFIASW
jgi:hypothetical protein